MPRKKSMSLLDVIELGKRAGVDEIEVDGIRVRFRLPEPELPPEEEERPTDWKTEELRALLHSTDLTDEEIEKMSQ